MCVRDSTDWRISLGYMYKSQCGICMFLLRLLRRRAMISRMNPSLSDVTGLPIMDNGGRWVDPQCILG